MKNMTYRELEKKVIEMLLESRKSIRLPAGITGYWCL